MTKISKTKEKELELISSIINSNLTENLNNNEIKKYIKNEIVYYHNQLKDEISKKNCDEEFNKYKEFHILGIEEHGVVGIPIRIITQTNETIFVKLNLYSDSVDTNILNVHTSNYFEYTITNLLYNLVKFNITNNIIKPLNYYNCKKSLILDKIFELYENKYKSYKKLQKIKKNQFKESSSSKKTKNSSKSNNLSSTNDSIIYAYKLIKNKFNMNNNKSVKMNREYEMIKWKPNSNISLLEMEWINGIQLSKHLNNLIISNDRYIEDKYLSSLFQNLYTLIVINKVYNKFQHNDIHLNNVLIDYSENNNKKSNIYELWDSQYEIKLKDTGIIKIIDFDKSNINHLDNRRIKAHFSKDLYNHLDNNYDSLYIIYGHYKVLFHEYFVLLNNILELTNSDKIKYSILIFTKHIKTESKSSDISDFTILNKYEIIIIIKSLFFFRDINKDLTKKDIVNFVEFFNGNPDLINTQVIQHLISKMNIIRNIIKNINNLMSYIPFFDIYINGKFANIIMTDYKNKNDKKYTTLQYFDNKIDKYNNFLLKFSNLKKNDDKLLLYIKKFINEHTNITFEKIEDKVILLLDNINKIYKSLKDINKEINKNYNKISNSELYLNNEIIEKTFKNFKLKKKINKNSSKVNNIYSDKNISKIVI